MKFQFFLELISHKFLFKKISTFPYDFLFIRMIVGIVYLNYKVLIVYWCRDLGQITSCKVGF
jgi:hypothetical protein